MCVHAFTRAAVACYVDCKRFVQDKSAFESRHTYTWPELVYVCVHAYNTRATVLSFMMYIQQKEDLR